MKLITRIPLSLAVAAMLFWPALNFPRRAEANVTPFHLLATPLPAPSGHSVGLSWTAPAVDATHVAAAGYNVKRATVSGGPYTTIGTTTAPTVTFVDSNVAAGQKFFYVVTATCPTCAESAPSNEVAVTVPLDQLNPVTGLVGAAN